MEIATVDAVGVSFLSYAAVRNLVDPVAVEQHQALLAVARCFLEERRDVLNLLMVEVQPEVFVREFPQPHLDKPLLVEDLVAVLLLRHPDDLVEHRLQLSEGAVEDDVFRHENAVRPAVHHPALLHQ